MSELARWTTDGTLVLEPRAARVRVDLNELAAADGHRVNCAFSLGLQPVDRPADRKMLEEAFRGAAGVLRVEDVCAHLKPALLVAAKRAVAKREGEVWLGEKFQEELREVLIAAARSATFTCGIEAIAPFQIELRSPTLDQHRLTEMRQKIADREAGSLRERMQQSADVMAQFVRLRAQAPDVPAGKLLEQIGASNPAALLETLLIASAGETRKPQSLWIVAGNELIALSDEDGAVQQSLEIPPMLGPLRSVTSGQQDGRPILLIGARSGVAVFDPDAPDAPPVVYRADQTQSQLGFNRAVIRNRRLHATHGEANLISWNLDAPDAPAARLLPPPSGHPRHLSALDDERLIYSNGSEIIIGDAADQNEVHVMAADVVEILLLDREILIITADGAMHRWDRATLAPISVTRHARAVTAAALLPWLDEPRLLLATSDGSILCAGLSDALTTQYLSAHRGFRALAATQRAVVALAGDRQRLVFWDAWNGRSPAKEVHAAQRFKHRVADLCFA